MVTFSILGHMAHNQGMKVEEVVSSGPGLVFITYPEVVLKMTGGSLWAVIFFFMLVVSTQYLPTYVPLYQPALISKMTTSKLNLS